MAGAFVLDDRSLGRIERPIERLVHRHEPLRRAAEDDLGLRAPRMRVGVLIVVACREQCARLAQVRTDRAVGCVEGLVDDAAAALVIAAEPRPVVAIAPVGHDREDRLDPMFAAQQEIVLAMVG